MWRKLFKKAVFLLDAAGIPRREWTFGGDTALMLYYDHRESRGVDIFVTDAQCITLLTPRLNPCAAEFAEDYTEASSFVKLKSRDGDIDIVVAPHLTREYAQLRSVEGETIQIETPQEIVIKKLFYRAGQLKVRDVVDTAAVYKNHRVCLLNEVSLLGRRILAIERRWEKIKKTYPLEAELLLGAKPALIEEAPPLFDAFLKEAKKILN